MAVVELQGLAFAGHGELTSRVSPSNHEGPQLAFHGETQLRVDLIIGPHRMAVRECFWPQSARSTGAMNPAKSRELHITAWWELRCLRTYCPTYTRTDRDIAAWLVYHWMYV